MLRLTNYIQALAEELKKQGKGVDGVYNQDISPKSMLLEVGG